LGQCSHIFYVFWCVWYVVVNHFIRNPWFPISSVFLYTWIKWKQIFVVR
jgi:hypothetical protein